MYKNAIDTSTSSGVTLSGTYETLQDYIDALNAETTWVNYDSQTGKATITSIEDFVTACKTASKSVGAFDDLNESQGEKHYSDMVMVQVHILIQ